MRDHTQCWALAFVLTGLVWAGMLGCGATGEPVRASALSPQSTADSALLPSLENLSASVLVVYNSQAEESRTVAEYYVRQRKIPLLHLCGIAFPAEASVRGDHYLEQVKKPLRACLERVGKRRILYVVMSYRTPFRVMIPGQRFDASLDSLVADIWDEANQEPLPARVVVPHPYFAAHDSAGNRFTQFIPFEAFREEHEKPLIYSVWRLDGASAEIATGLVDKAIAAEAAGGPRGNACFDRNTNDVRTSPDSGYGIGEWDVQRAADLAKMAGFSVVLDTHSQEFGEAPAPERCDAAALYAGWYSLNHYNDAFTWNEGAIGLHIDSMSAWHPREGPNWVHNALRKGITITAGAVSEPYLTNYTQADGVLYDLFHGSNVGDAFLRNTRLLKFRMAYFGDPLYRPFPGGKGPLAAGQQPLPVVRVRSPRTLGGVPAVVVILADGHPSRQRSVRLSVHPAELGSVEDVLQFEPGLTEKEIRIPTAGVTKSTTLRLVAEGESGFAAGAVQVLPVLVRLEPESQQLPGGSPGQVRVQLGAVVQSGTAPVDVQTNCPKWITIPSRVMVPAGQEVAVVPIETRPVPKETTCEVAVSKFGSTLRATLVLSPAAP